MIWVSISDTAKISAISRIRSTPRTLMSSSRPKKGETYVAPALAASSAWLAEKTRVTLVLIPSFARTFTAFKPSTVMGIFTTMFLWIAAISLPSRIMPSASVVVAFTSPLIGPSTIWVISRITSLKSRPSLAIRDGLVVTPQITPMSSAFLISSTFAVSTKKRIFISSSIWLPVYRAVPLKLVLQAPDRGVPVDVHGLDPHSLCPVAHLLRSQVVGEGGMVRAAC